MLDMYRVLVPVDNKESRARAQIEAVLEVPVAIGDLAVDILHVHDEVPASDAEWAAGDSFADAYTEEMADAVRDADRIPTSVEAAIDTLEDSGYEFAVHERSGDPASEILDIAAELNSNAIVLGVSRRSPVGKVLFGSVVQAVVLESDQPVTVVPEHTSES